MMKSRLRAILAATMLFIGCCAYGQNTSSIAPGALNEIPADIVTHLEKKGIFEFFSYNKDLQDNVRKQLIELQKYKDGKRKFYPADEINEVLTSMQGIIIGRHLHSGDDFTNDHTAFYALLDIAINLCPDINLLAQHCSSDHTVGVIDFPDNYMGIFYHTVMCKVGEKKFKAHTLALPDEIEDYHYDKIRKISEKDGAKTYIISDENYFDVYILTISRNGEISSCKPANHDKALTEWFRSKKEDYNNDTKILFNPKKVCWELCYWSGNVFKRVEGTKALYLEFKNGKPVYTVK